MLPDSYSGSDFLCYCCIPRHCVCSDEAVTQQYFHKGSKVVDTQHSAICATQLWYRRLYNSDYNVTVVISMWSQASATSGLLNSEFCCVNSSGMLGLHMCVFIMKYSEAIDTPYLYPSYSFCIESLYAIAFWLLFASVFYYFSVYDQVDSDVSATLHSCWGASFRCPFINEPYCYC